MSKEVIIVGLGEMGGVFARGLLRSGYTVIPANRDTDLSQMAGIQPRAVVIAVGEKDLHQTIQSVPEGWKDGDAQKDCRLPPRSREHRMPPSFGLPCFRGAQP